LQSDVKKQTFLHGALILTISGIIVKFIGFIYKIPMTRIFGEETMGYYNSALSIYTTMYVLSTSGLPVTVSRMVSSAIALKKFRDTSRILKISLLVYSSISFLIAIFMLFFSKTIASWTGNDPAFEALIAVAPAIFFVSAVAGLRGFFQGHQDMMSTGISNILESFFNLVVGFSLALILLKAGFPLSTVAAGAAVGVSVSAAISLLYMFIIYLKNRNSTKLYLNQESFPATPYKQIASEFLKASLPILIGALTMNLTNTIDVFVLMNRLIVSGYTSEYANFVYGSYTSMAVLLYNMPATITAAICTSAIPALSRSYTLQQPERIKSAIDASFRMNALIAFPIAFGMSVMSGPILNILFSNRPEGVAIATPLLNILGLAVIPLSIATVSTSMLQAIKKPHIPVINIFIAGLIKFLMNYFLIANPNIRIFGAPFATFICYLIITILNLHQLKKNTGVFPSISSAFTKPLFSSVLCAAGAFLLYKAIGNFVPNLVSTVISVLFGMAIYLISLYFCKGITAKDIEILPFGKKIKKILEKIRIMR